MYIKKRISALELVAANGKILLLLLITVGVTTTVYLELLHPYVKISMTVVGALEIAISFFIAFFTAQAYDRWWEARKIWGTFVNDSRSFGRMVVTLFAREPVEVTAMQGRLIRRHIAYLYAVKENLRRETTREYFAQLSDEDRERVAGLTHPANGLLQLQGEEIDGAERKGYIDVIRLAQFNDMLNRFSTSMGMSERIKLTVFPAYYASMIRVAIWCLVLIYPIALGDSIGYRAIPYSFLLGAIFLLVYIIGQTLLDPFEGRPTDTPMSSIIRTIEINLLEQIGETDIPAPLEPVDGSYLL